MDTLYFDWSHRTGITTVKNDEDVTVVYPTLDAMLNTLAVPYRLIGETTFESFSLARRAKFIDRCQAAGHDLFTTPNRLTGRARKRMDIEKTDPNDARVIRSLVKAGCHLKRATILLAGQDKPRKDAAQEIMTLRSTGDYSPRPRSKGFNFLSFKDQWAELLIEAVPDYSGLTDVQKIALGDGRKYSLSRIAAVGMAARHAANTREFDRLAGLYAHGYPSQIRADLHHYGWAGGNMRPRLNDAGKRDDITLSEYRRELRWLYHQLKDVVREIPFPGSLAEVS